MLDRPIAIFRLSKFSLFFGRITETSFLLDPPYLRRIFMFLLVFNSYIITARQLSVLQLSIINVD